MRLSAPNVVQKKNKQQRNTSVWRQNLALLAHEQFILPKYIQRVKKQVSSDSFAIQSDYALVDNSYDPAHFLFVLLTQ